MFRLDGKTAVITGGAGPNIGRSVTMMMAERGAQVAVLDIDIDNGEDIVSTISNRDTYNDAIFVKTDVTEIESIRDAMATVVKEYGDIDILVNSAGVASGTTLESINEEEFDQNIELNLKSAFFCTRAALPQLKETGGSVVFVSSVNALFGGLSEVAYASAKGGLHSLCRGLTADYAEHDIRFNVVCLGSIIGESTIWQDRENEQPGILGDLAEMYPLKRYGEPEDAAHAVCFLVSDESSWINGVVLPVDGGLTAVGNLPGNQWWESL